MSSTIAAFSINPFTNLQNEINSLQSQITGLTVGTGSFATLNFTNGSGANMNLQNLAVNGGAAIGGQLNVGYSGQRIFGLNGTTSLEILSGDVLMGTSVASAVGITGTLNVSSGITTASTLNVSGASTLAAVSATSITDSGALNVTGLSTLGAVNATSVNASGSVLGATVGATTGTFTNLSVTSLFSVSTGAGVNSIMGQATLGGATTDVLKTNIVATDYIFLSKATNGGAGTGILSYTITPNTKFAINSTDGTDNSIVNYFIIRQS